MFDYCYDYDNETPTFVKYYDNGMPLVEHYWDDEKGVKTVIKYFDDGEWMWMSYRNKDDVKINPDTMQPTEKSKNVIN